MAEIIGAERVTEIYGGWPAFHDAEVLRVRLDHDGAQGAALEADIHVFEMTSEVDAKGFFVLRDHHIVTLRFDGLTGLSPASESEHPLPLQSVKQVQVWLGHADSGFTVRTYTHLMDDGLGDADFLDDVVGDRPTIQ